MASAGAAGALAEAWACELAGPADSAPLWGCGESSSSEDVARSRPSSALASGGRRLLGVLALLGATVVLGVAVTRTAGQGTLRTAMRLKERNEDLVLQKVGIPSVEEDLELEGPPKLPLEQLSREELIERVKSLSSSAGAEAHGTRFGGSGSHEHGSSMVAVAAESPAGVATKGTPEQGEARFRSSATKFDSSFGDGEGDITNITDCGRKCLVGVLSEALLDRSTGKCAAEEDNCMVKKCCSNPGLQCFTKNATYAKCKTDCMSLDLLDEEADIWSCRKIGFRSPGLPVKCSDVGKNCIHTKCCATPGTTCFLKNASFAACKAKCPLNQPDQFDEDPQPWSCRPLGAKAKGAASWVARTCSKGYQECSATRCCSEAGMQCFEKDTYWAQCMPSCTAKHGAGADWTCRALSEPSPEKALNTSQVPLEGKVAKWVATKCAQGYDDCSKSQCCKEPGHQCYLKTEFWGMCKENCTKGKDPYDKQNWSCEKVGPRSWGLAFKGWPSLYCWALVRTHGYEKVLIRKQAEASAGIFACDGHNIVADGKLSGIDNLKIQADQDMVGVSSDGTAANTLLFIKSWQAIIKQGDFVLFDWTLKVDPDTVLVPERVRTHLRPHTGKGKGKQYVLNCNAFPDRPDFPMMYGALEVFSRKAVQQFAWGHEESCVDKFHWQDWGEDVFVVSCMNALGVETINDFKLVGDNNCVGHDGRGGANCNDAEVAAFHPFKDIHSWISCFHSATGHLLTATEQDEVDSWT